MLGIIKMLDIMKIHREKAIAFFVWCICLVVPCVANESEKYLFNFPLSDKSWLFQFPAKADKELYVSASLAIEIVSVYADGKEVASEKYMTITYPNYKTVKAEGGIVVYTFSRGFFNCWISSRVIEGEARYMRGFKVPDRFRYLVVKYRVRYPSGDLGNDAMVKFVASDEPATVLVIQ